MSRGSLRPERSASACSATSARPAILPHVAKVSTQAKKSNRGEERNDADPLARDLLDGLIQAQADDAARRIRPHADAVDHLRGLNSLAVVGDEDELRIPA